MTAYTSTGRCDACGQDGIEVYETVEHIGGAGMRAFRWCKDRLVCQCRQGWHEDGEKATTIGERSRNRLTPVAAS